ncbi:MAG: hypothetical protein WD845_10750 [Pirellulales bacterium]
MATQIKLRLRSMVLLTVALTTVCGVAAAQQGAAPAAKKPAQAAAPANSSLDDATRKSEMLASSRWRRAMFELNEWLSGQQIYSPQQVTKWKKDFSANVHRMTADQLELTLADLEAKFQIMQTPQAQDARAWLARYLSILSDKKRAELLSKLPNIETMTAAQLQQTIERIEGRKAAEQKQQQQVTQLRDTAQNPWTQYTKMAEQAYVADHAPGAGGYSSPYRPATGKRPFEGIKTGPDMGLYVGPYGGVGISLGMGGW